MKSNILKFSKLISQKLTKDIKVKFGRSITYEIVMTNYTYPPTYPPKKKSIPPLFNLPKSPNQNCLVYPKNPNFTLPPRSLTGTNIFAVNYFNKIYSSLKASIVILTF